MNFSKLEAYLSTLPACGIPGCELAVTYRGETVFRSGVGFADAELTRPVSQDDLYFVFSISKITTCVAALRLWEEGRLGLDDPVSKYLPSYAYLTVKNEKGKPAPAQNTMTVRHLFTMTGGLNYDLNAQPIMRVRQSDDQSTVSIASALAEAMLDFEPGTKFQYSLCHDVLGAVVEVASGMRFGDYVKKYILDPLGMTDTGYHVPDALWSRMSAIYNFTHGLMKPTPIPVETSNVYVLTPDFDSGGAGLYSTVNDQIKLMTTLACGGTTPDGYTLLRPETIRMMGENGLADSARPYFMPSRLYGYSWGLCGRAHVDPVVSGSRSSVGEFGWDGAAGAFAMVDPTKQVALYFGMHVRGCNYAYHHVHPTLRDLVYECIEGEK